MMQKEVLSPQNVLSRPDKSYGRWVDADILRMDESQLMHCFGAVAMGMEFEAFPDISFLPWTVRFELGTEFEGFARLYAQAGKTKERLNFNKDDLLPRPYGEYIDPEFRTRLTGVLKNILSDAAEEKDVLARFDHTPEHPWIARDGYPVSKKYLEEDRTQLVQACLTTLNWILVYDGENSPSDQVKRVITEHPVQTIGQFSQRVGEAAFYPPHPELKAIFTLTRTLLLKRGANKKYEVSPLIIDYLLEIPNK